MQHHLSSYHTVTPPPDLLCSASLGGKGEIQQHLSSSDMVPPPPDPPLSCLFRAGREKYNSNSPLQQGGKGEIQQHLSSYDTVTPPPDSPLPCLFRAEREKYNSISLVLSISPVKF